MKKNTIFCSLVLFILIGASHYADAQVTVTSTTGYLVDINVQPASIIPSTTNCTWGYNYNVTLNYQISLIGSNKPASLYTLQGTVGCNSASNFFDLPNGGGVGITTSTSNTWVSTSNCNTSTPATMNCNTINIQISGPGISNQTVSYPVTYISLPVTLVNFTANVNSNKVSLRWSTATEMNSNYFIIERQAGSNEWKEIGKIKSAGNSTMALNYSFDDESPAVGTSYYRLRQVDLDGHAAFSPVVAVEFKNRESRLAIYPVPNAGNHIQVQGIDFKKYDLTITDINQRVLFTTSSVSSSMDLPLLKPGLYLLRFNDRLKNEPVTVRYVKL